MPQVVNQAANSLQATPRPKRQTTCITLNESGEALVFSPKDNCYYGLNASAAFTWALLLEGLSLAATSKLYSERFHADPVVAATDVETFAHEVETRGWIENIFEPKV